MKSHRKRASVAGDVTGSTAPQIHPLELAIVVFVTGASVMVIEILGTRIIGPVFGVGLFVWSALLAVTLASLAAGYYLGGRLVDRAPNSRLLHLVAIVAGLLLAAVPAIRHGVLSLGQTFGTRSGPLFSALLLFAPALLALGTVGPISARLATRDMDSIGRRVGGMYAISTTGSLVGTFLVGFVLIPTYDVNQILLGTAMLLVVIGAAPLAVRNRRPAMLLLILVPLLSRLLPEPELPPGFTLLDRAHSLYGLVEVIDDASRDVRFLRVDHSIIGAEVRRTRESAFSFVYLLELVRFMRPDARALLQLGLGTGSLLTALAPYGIVSDFVEIDPAVIRFASSYFGFTPNGAAFTEDARTFLNRTERKYDIVVHDTFTGGSTPAHLLSREVLGKVKTILKPGGLLVLNFVGGTAGAEAEASWAVARTLRSVFKSVRAFGDEAPDHRAASIQNIVFFASDDAMNFEAAAHAHFKDPDKDLVRSSFLKWEMLTSAEHAIGAVITDDLNPLSRLELPIAEEHASAMNKLLPAELWLH
jgi:spermidine synthase